LLRNAQKRHKGSDGKGTYGHLSIGGAAPICVMCHVSGGGLGISLRIYGSNPPLLRLQSAVAAALLLWLVLLPPPLPLSALVVQRLVLLALPSCPVVRQCGLLLGAEGTELVPLAAVGVGDCEMGCV
jgi:hypothetical protein